MICSRNNTIQYNFICLLIFKANVYAKAYLALGLKKGDRLIISGVHDKHYGGMTLGALMIGLMITTVIAYHFSLGQSITYCLLKH